VSAPTSARPAPPPVEHQYPLCSVCHQETYHDGDSLRCDTCNAYWPSDGGAGVWVCDSDELPSIQCASIVAPYRHSPTAPDTIRSFLFRCSLDHNHVDETPPERDRYGLMGPDRRRHRSVDRGGQDWGDDDPTTVVAHNRSAVRAALDEARDAELDRLYRERQERWRRQAAERAARADETPSVNTVPTGGLL
jgi:hypothetical protein